MRDLGKFDTISENQRFKSAFKEYTCTHLFKACGKSYALEVLCALKCILLNIFERRSRRNNKNCDICVSKCFASDKRYGCGNGYAFKRGIHKRFCLNLKQSFGKNDCLDSTILERTAAYCRYGRAEIEGAQINTLRCNKVFNYCYITRCEGCILIVARCIYRSYTGIICLESVVPVFVKILGHTVSSKIEIKLICSKERIAAYMFYIYRNRKLRKALTAIESISANIGQRFGECNARNTFAESEGKVIYIYQLRVTEIDACEVIHTFKGVRLNAGKRSSVIEGNALEILASVEHIRRDALELAVLRERYGIEILTSFECALSYSRNICRNCKVLNTRICKCAVADTRKFGGGIEVYCIQIVGFCESISAYLQHVIGDIDVTEIEVFGECILLNLHKCRRETVRICAATVESVFAYLRHSLGEYNRAKLGCSCERPWRNRTCRRLNGIRALFFSCGIHVNNSIVKSINHSIDVMVYGIAVFNFNRSKCVTARKCTVTEFRYACRNRNVLQATAHKRA